MPGSTFTVSVRVAIADQREALIVAIVSPVSFKASLKASETTGASSLTPLGPAVPN